jgi:hypothetical protein
MYYLDGPIGEVLLNKGKPQGNYRVEREGIWSVGTLRDSLVLGACWTVLKDHVRLLSMDRAQFDRLLLKPS